MNESQRSLPRRVALAALWTIIILSLLIGVNVLGIVMIGSPGQWDRWLIEHQVPLFVWRLFLYAALALGWFWMRRRVINRENSGEASSRLHRAEISAVLAIALVEMGGLLREG